jgi:hypothetical protein
MQPKEIDLKSLNQYITKSSNDIKLKGHNMKKFQYKTHQSTKNGLNRFHYRMPINVKELREKIKYFIRQIEKRHMNLGLNL